MGILSKIFKNKASKEPKALNESNPSSANIHYEIPKLTTIKIGEESAPVCKCDKDGLLIGWSYNDGFCCRAVYSRLKNKTIVEWLKIMSEEDSRVIGEIYRVFKEYEKKCEGYGEDQYGDDE